MSGNVKGNNFFLLPYKRILNNFLCSRCGLNFFERGPDPPGYVLGSGNLFSLRNVISERPLIISLEKIRPTKIVWYTLGLIPSRFCIP